MIFNLGMPNLRSWTKFNAAIKAKDWKKAAGESKRRPPVSPDRNKYVKDLLEKAAKKEKEKTAKNTDITTKTAEP